MFSLVQKSEVGYLRLRAFGQISDQPYVFPKEVVAWPFSPKREAQHPRVLTPALQWSPEHLLCRPLTAD